MIRIKAPDDSIVQFPDGTDEATIKSVMQKNFGGPEPSTNEPREPSPLENIIIGQYATPQTPGYRKAKERWDKVNQSDLNKPGFLQAMVAPFADDALGAAEYVRQGGVNLVRSALGKPIEITAKDAYGGAADSTREAFGKYAAAHPVANVGANLLGGLMMGPAKAAPATRGLLTAVKEGAKQGGIGGILYGAFDEDGGLVDRAMGALQGGTAGVLTGGLLPLAIRGGKAVVNGIANTSSALTRALGVNPMTETEGVQRATDYLGKTLNRDGISIDQMKRRLANGRQSGMTIADVGGENTVSALRTAAQSPGPARNRVTQFAKDRQSLQRDRIADVTESTFGSPNTEAAAADIAGERGARAANDFKGALGQGIVRSKRLSALFQSPTLRSAIPYAQKIAGDEYALARAEGNLGAADREDWAKAVSELPNKTAFPAKYLHHIKMGLDEHLESFRDPITKIIPYSSPVVRAADNVRKAFRAEVKRMNPKYAEALDNFSNQSRLITAQRDGAAAIKMTPAEINTVMARYSPAEREQFRMGFGRSIRDMIEKTRDNTNAAQQIMGTEAVRKRITQVLGRDAEKYLGRIGAENRKFETGRALGGSQTTPRALDEADMNSGAALDMIRAGARGGGIRGAADAAVSWMTRRYEAANGMTEQVKHNLALMLISEDPKLQVAALNVLERAAPAASQSRYVPGGVVGAAERDLRLRKPLR